MKTVLIIYLGIGALLGMLTFMFGLFRGRSVEQHVLMNSLKWLLGASSVALAWPVAGYWVVEGELNRRRAIKEKPIQS